MQKPQRTWTTTKRTKPSKRRIQHLSLCIVDPTLVDENIETFPDGTLYPLLQVLFPVN